jgi:hypothetical protein
LVSAAQSEGRDFGYSPEPAARRILQFLVAAMDANDHRILDRWAQLTDEVFPTIYGTFRIPREVKKESESKDVASPAAIREVRYHLQRLSRAIDALSESEQKSLFVDNPKYGYRPKTRRTEK